MAIDRVNPYVTASYEGRHGTYALSVFGPSPGPGSPSVLSLAEAPQITFGEPEKIFGGGLVATSADYLLEDPAAVIDGLFGDSFDSEDWEVQVSGSDGLGGTWGVHTRPMQGELQGSASPLTRGDTPAALGTHDGLATLKDVDGLVTSYVDLANLLGRLWYAMPGRLTDVTSGIWDMRATFPISVPEATDSLVSRYRFAGELTGEADSGDYGTVEDQMLALAEVGTLSIFQPTDAPGTWEIRTRSRVGSSGACSLITGDGTTASAAADTYTDRETALPSFTQDAGGNLAGRLRRVSQVRMTGTGQVIYAIPSDTLGDFDETEVTIARFEITAGLRFYLPDRRYEFVHGAGTQILGSYRLELLGDDATTYYGPDWATSTQTMAPDAATTADIPIAGTLTLVLVGEDANLDTDNDPGTPDETVAATFAPGTLELEDTAGDPITDFALSIGSPGGESIELTLPPGLEGYDGASWVAATSYTSTLDAGVCGSIGACVADIRLSQQGSNLRTLLVQVTGLHGPQSRFTMQGTDNGNTSSPFAEDVDLIAVGGVANLREGWTLLSLVSAYEVP